MLNNREKVEIYEQLLHQIQMYAEVVMDHKKVAQLISNICNWSYAHRVGNGALSEDEQQAKIDFAIKNLLKVD